MSTSPQALSGYAPMQSASLADIVTGMGQPKANIAQTQAQTGFTNAATQGQQLENQQKQIALKDQQILGDAFRQSGGDPNSMLKLAVQNGISPAGYMGFQGSQVALQQKYAELGKSKVDTGKTKLDIEEKQNQDRGQVYGTLSQLGRVPTDPEIAAAQAQLARDPTHPVPTADQLRDPGFLQLQNGFSGYQKTLIAQAKDKAATAESLGKAAESSQKVAGERRQQSVADLQALPVDPATGTPSPQAIAPWLEKYKDVLPPSFSPTAQGIAQLMRSGVPVEKQPEYDIKGTQAAAMKDPQTLARLNAQIDSAIDPAKGEAYAYENNMAKQAVAGILRGGGTPENAQAAIKDSADRIGRFQAGVATAKATAPIKIQVAGAEAQARTPQTSSDALDLMAENALAGQMPSSRNPILYARVMDRAAQLAKERGLSSQQAVMERNAAQANKGAYAAVTKQYETLKPFAEMAEKNADLLEQKLSQVSDLGASVLNTPLRELEGKFGSTKVATLKASLLPVQADFARILNSPTGSGVLSDDARHEMERAITPGATVGQMRAAL